MIDSFLLKDQMMPELIIFTLLYQIVILIIIKYILKKYLIEHPEYIQKYCDLKEKLAKQYTNDRPKYTKGKDEFIKSVIAKAHQEYDI